jgi:FtsH-binding integral membrane protein
MNRDKISRLVFRVVALAAILGGILSLSGAVAPMNSRTTEVILGTGALLLGLALLVLTSRRKSALPPSPIA